tara:strand:+ start:13519 stop:13620 length:102 start_codon:yes stop_codon:yes gene_type:complete
MSKDKRKEKEINWFLKCLGRIEKGKAPFPTKKK